MPQVIEIPEVGNVEFPDGMDTPAIEAAAKQLYTEARQANRDTYGPATPETDFLGNAARSIGPTLERNRLQGQMDAARRTGDRADLAANIFDTASDVLRPFASTPENPLGGFGSAARPVGAALNAVGDEAVRGAASIANSYGMELGPVSRDVVRAVPGITAAVAAGPALRAAGMAEAAAGPAAFGAVPFAQTLDATGDTFAASKAGLTGAAIPGVAEAGRAAAAKTLGALVERGIIGTGASAAGNIGQKVVEALGAQGAIQVFMEGMNLPEYVAMTPEERQAALLHNLAVNSAFLLMDVPGVLSRGASQTREGMKPVAKVGEVMETLVNDPATVKALTAAADKFALDQMNVRDNPRIAQLEAPPAEFANVEPQLIDPSLPRPTMGNEQRVVEDYVEPAPTETVVRAEDFVQRPAATIEPPTSPPAESRVQPVSAPEAKAPEAARPAEPVPQKPAKGTKKAKAKTVEPPAAAVEKVQEHVAEVAAGEKQATPEPALQHTTGPRAAKEIKSELVQRLEDAMAKAPDETALTVEQSAALGKARSTSLETGNNYRYGKEGDAKKLADIAELRRKRDAEARALGLEKVTLEIPGDGTFTVWNTKQSIAEVLKRAKSLDTRAKGPERQKVGAGRKTQGEIITDNALAAIQMYGSERAAIQAIKRQLLNADVDPDVAAKAGKVVEWIESRIEKWRKDLAEGVAREEDSLRRMKHSLATEEAIQKERGDKYTRERFEASKARRLEDIAKQETRANDLRDKQVAFERQNPKETADYVPAESINTGALGEAGMGGAKPTEFTAGSGTATSIKNATVDAERAKRGLPPAMEAGRRTWGEVWDRAMAVIDQDPTAQSTLIAQLKAKPRALTDLEDALLLHRQVDLQNQYGRLTRELAAAYDDAQAFPGRLEAVERLKVLVQETSNQLFELYEVGKAAGTETGRGLAARKMLADEHFELAQMETDLRAAKEGASLTDAERVKLTQAHDTIKRLQTELDAATARAEEARAERRAAEATEDLKQAAKADPEYNPVVIKLAERIVETLERRGKAAEERLKAKFARTSAGVDPTILADVIEIGAGRIARKALPFAEWADGMLKEFGEAVKDYLEPAWAKIGDRMDRVATDIAGRKKGEALKKMRVLDEGQRRQKLIDSIGEAAGEDRPLDEIGTYVRRLALQFVKDGIHDRTKLVDAVHSVLVNHFDPDITRREAMDAISGYGDFKPLDPDPAKRTLRDLKGQLQSVAKLEDIEARRPLLKTGVERRAPSDEERRLIQQVNEAKRVHGVVTTDPARQLKSAQDGILTRLKHQIADLNFQIDAGERTVKSAAKVASTPEIDGLRVERDALKKRLDEMLPRPGISEAQRLAMAERALEADLALYEAKIAARDTGPLRAKSAKLHSEKLEQLRARRDVLKAELDELRAAANPKLSPEERALRTLKRRLATEYAKTMDRIARKDFTPRRRVKEPFMDAEAAKLKGQLDQAKTEWRKALVEEKRRNRSGWEKGWDVAKEVTHAQRQFWTSWDLSAVLRQGGIIALAHPGRALVSMPAMFRALSETQANAEWAKVQNRPNWTRYQRAKLYLSDPHETTITKLEEQVRSRWLQNVPGIKQSNQTYTTFLNKLRADSFDAMVSALERKGTTLTDAELQGIANYINISTGRGDFSKLAGAADAMAIGLFSPRLLLSRFQYILGQPLAKAGSWRVRRQLAAEYARTLTGFGVVLALGALAGAEIETDERSSDFLKLKIGNTRIDFGAGLLQPLVYLARTIHGETKTASGVVKPIRGTVPFGSQNWWDVSGNFARSKFSPSMSTAVDLLTGKNVVGEKVTPGTVALDFAVPLSFRDVASIMEEQGVAKGTVIQLLGLLGAGVGQYKNDAKTRAVVGELMKTVRGGTPEQREAIRDRLTKALTK